MSLGPAEILVILVVALLVFGPTKLPEIGRQVGRGVREFRKFQTTLRSDLDHALSQDASGDATPAPTLPPLEPAPDARTAPPMISSTELPTPPVQEPASPSLPADPA